VDFKNTILIMTSNLKEEELRLRMRPEFLNRIDEIIKFDALTKDDIREIVVIQMSLLRKKLEEALREKEEAASEKAEARQSARELKKLKRAEKKRERQLRREERRKERAARRQARREARQNG
jgi:hypothetical protein